MAKKELNYEEALREAELILNRIQNGAVSVDDLPKEVKRATELIAACKARLLKAEAEVEKLIE